MYLRTFVSLMTFTLYCLRRLPCPSDGFALTSPAEASVFWRIRWCQDVQVCAVGWGASGVSVGPCSVLSSYVFPLRLTARHQQRYFLLSPVPVQSYPAVFFFPPLSSPQLSSAPVPQFVVLNDLIGHQTVVKRRPLEMKIRLKKTLIINHERSVS